MTVPAYPKIYHIVHWDRLPSIIEQDCLWSHAEVDKRALPGTTIGYEHVKALRKKARFVSCHAELQVGECVPFNFCPRSVMLYVLYRHNSEYLTYLDGEEPIVHLEADLFSVVAWANSNGRRWAFTTSNAAEMICDSYCDLQYLDLVNWDAVHANKWPQVSGSKQAEFLIERNFPWSLVERIGIHQNADHRNILNIIAKADHRPQVEIMRGWYYGT